MVYIATVNLKKGQRIVAIAGQHMTTMFSIKTGIKTTLSLLKQYYREILGKINSRYIALLYLQSVHL